MNSPASREVADALMRALYDTQDDAIGAAESALAAAEARGRAAGEADMRETCGRVLDDAAKPLRAKMEAGAGSLDEHHRLEVLAERYESLAETIRALSLSAPAKQEGSDAT